MVLNQLHGRAELEMRVSQACRGTCLDVLTSHLDGSRGLPPGLSTSSLTPPDPYPTLMVLCQHRGSLNWVMTCASLCVWLTAEAVGQYQEG